MSKSSSRAGGRSGFWAWCDSFLPWRTPAEPARRMALLGTSLVVLAFLALGSLYVRQEVHGDSRFYLDSWRLEVGDLPSWVTPEIRSQLESVDLRLTETEERLSLFEPGVLKRVKAALEAQPWVEKVSSVRLRYPGVDAPGTLELDLELRVPVALLEHGKLYYLVDGAGRRLGAPYRESPNRWFGVPTIIGFQGGAPPANGERWRARDLQQGIEVAKLLLENDILCDFPEQPVQVIDLANLHGRVDPRESEIVLWSGRQRLAWGRSPISAGARPVAVSEIVGNLRYVLSHPETFGEYAVIHLHRRREDLTGIRG